MPRGDCSPDVAMLSRLLAVLLFAACASGLKMMPPAPRSAAMCSRRAVPLVAAGVAFARRAPAFAADKSAKEDKKFIACLSECVYTEMKIAKGLAEVEVVSKADAYARCEQHAQKVGARERARAPARPLQPRLLRERLLALGSSAVPGWLVITPGWGPARRPLHQP